MLRSPTLGRSVPSPSRARASCSPTRLRRSLAACFLPLLLIGSAARAQDTDEDDDVCEAGAVFFEDDLQVRPPDGATGVARNAPLMVRYEHAADLDELERLAVEEPSAACAQLVCLFRDASEAGGAEREPVPGNPARVDARTLLFVPSKRLAADTRYYVLVARPGFERLTRSEREFETGRDDDEEPPELALGNELQVDLQLMPRQCQVPTGSVRVRVAVPHVSDDGDEDSVEVLLYLTRAAGLAGPELRARAPNGGATPMTLMLTPEQARGSVCLAVRAVDGVGRVAKYDEEVCFEAREGGYFQAACSAVAPGVRRAARPGPWRVVALSVRAGGGRAVRMPGAGPDARFGQLGGPRRIAAVSEAVLHWGVLLLPLAAMIVRRRTPRPRPDRGTQEAA